MKSTFTTKLLQHLNKKKQEGGFTLIELLVVIIIIGILAAIALPSFLNQANKARQSEAKTYVGSMNRAQQAYYLENGRFTASLPDLGLGIQPDTANYGYTITITGTSPNSVANNKGTAKQTALKGYAGGVSLTSVGNNANDVTTSAILCEANNIGTAAPADGTANGSVITCPTGMTAIQ